MDFGLVIFPTLDTVAPGEIARMAEERGFESLWFPEHTHIPASRDTPYPTGGDLLPQYSRTLDPFVALTAAAAATDHILLGTAVCLVTQRDPIITAKEVASVDQLSGGRMLFGVGAGWNVEEMRNHATEPATRFGLMRERVEAMKTIWTQDEATYAGRHVHFERIWCWPKPAQKPHPPVLIGGNGERVLDRVLRYGDAWMPNLVGDDDDHMLERIAELRRRAEDAGRDVSVTLNPAPAETSRLERYADAGVERCVLSVPSENRSDVEARLDWIQGVITPLVAA